MKNKFGGDENQSLENWIETKTLKITKDYPDFKTFYDNERKDIYLEHVTAFENLQNTREVEKTITVIGVIDGQEFTTNFEISKKSFNGTSNALISFFESIEDYETCTKLVNLRQYFQNN